GPLLEGLQDLQRRLKKDYGVLRVGVRELPQYFWPAWAAADSEKQALPLLFESLLIGVRDPLRGFTYQPSLARALPEVVPLGRQFELVRDARWSDDGSPVVAADVRQTVDSWRRRAPPGAAEWEELVKSVEQDSSSAF